MINSDAGRTINFEMARGLVGELVKTIGEEPGVGVLGCIE